MIMKVILKVLNSGSIFNTVTQTYILIGLETHLWQQSLCTSNYLG